MVSRYLPGAHKRTAWAGSDPGHARGPRQGPSWLIYQGFLALQYLVHGRTKACRRRRNTDAGCFHCSNLALRITIAAGHDGTRMAHRPSRRHGLAGDEADHRFLAAFLGLVDQELRGFFFRAAADLTDHDDGFGFVIGKEHFEDVDKFRAFDWVAAECSWNEGYNYYVPLGNIFCMRM